ncbi:MAG: hypothetical protein ACJ75J_09915 [Cytophagaceae bacterium]
MMRPEKIQDILSLLQEAVFEELSMSGSDLNFKIECRYLADLIHKDYSCFYGVFKGCDDFYFTPWEDEMAVVVDVKEVKLFRPDILTVEVAENGYIKIYSNCQNTYSGGNIYIKSSCIKIYDEDLQELSLEGLADLSDKYWYSDKQAEG